MKWIWFFSWLNFLLRAYDANVLFEYVYILEKKYIETTTLPEKENISIILSTCLQANTFQNQIKSNPIKSDLIISDLLNIENKDKSIFSEKKLLEISISIMKSCLVEITFAITVIPRLTRGLRSKNSER